jgi:hypothetical protein
MVKIVSGYSEKGGSTTAFINLTNIFNENGIDCTFYGPHEWHLDKCKGDLLKNYKPNSDDRLITHFIQFPKRPIAKKVVLSCHEKWWFEVGDLKQYWDTAIFLHQQHKDYHWRYNGESVIIPNFKEDLISKEKSNFSFSLGKVFMYGVSSSSNPPSMTISASVPPV